MRLDAARRFIAAAPSISRLLRIAQRARRLLRAAIALSRPSGGRFVFLRGHSMTTETWTPDRVEQLRSFVVTGLTCSQIAAQIGVSRNAVIGKIHRLGLSPARPPGGAARSCPPRARHPRAPRAPGQRRLLRLMWSDGAPANNTEAAPAPVDSAQPCSLLDLERGKCRWPLGEPTGAAGPPGDFIFCGNAAADGFSYCPGHARMAYRVPARRSA
jgi:GcrA cell cycle regulator